jgi:hypothetical protein
MGIPLLRGALIPETWIPGPGMQTPILVSDTAARRFWPGANPVGQLVRFGPAEGVVLGVVGDVRYRALSAEPEPAVYLPPFPRGVTTFVVRTAGDPRALVQPIRQTIRELDPNQPIRELTALTSVLAESIVRDRFFTVLYGVFGTLALMLAAIGVYGVFAYSVGQRTQEIGVRVAVGAQASDVLGLVLVEAIRLVTAGVVFGGIAALALTRLLEGRLYGVSTTDPTTFIVAAAVLFLTALFACYVPARRAMRVDPLAALRNR